MSVEREEVEATLAAIVDVESENGASWWPGVEMAPIAYRRLTTFERRRKNNKQTTKDRALDLAKGLTAHFEPEIPYTHPSDWLHLSELLVSAFIKHNE